MSLDRLRNLNTRTKAVLAIPSGTAALVDAMRKVLQAAFALYFKSHVIHWNVTGAGFPQYHAFFDDIYNALHDAVDAYAEHVRALGEKAPTSLATTPEGQGALGEDADFGTMLASFDKDNDEFIGMLKMAIDIAGQVREPGVQNFLQDRLDYHQKLAWQLKATRG